MAVSELFTLKTSLNPLSFKELFVYLRQIIAEHPRQKMSKWQETINRKNSKLCVRVEHVFGFMEENLHGMYSRVIGFARNAAFNTLTNLVYNLCRYEQVMRLGMN